MEVRSHEGAEQDLNLAGSGVIPEVSKGLIPLGIEIMMGAKQFPKQGSRHMGQQALPRVSMWTESQAHCNCGRKETKTMKDTGAGGARMHWVGAYGSYRAHLCLSPLLCPLIQLFPLVLSFLC